MNLHYNCCFLVNGAAARCKESVLGYFLLKPYWVSFSLGQETVGLTLHGSFSDGYFDKNCHEKSCTTCPVDYCLQSQLFLGEIRNHKLQIMSQYQVERWLNIKKIMHTNDGCLDENRHKKSCKTCLVDYCLHSQLFLGEKNRKL